MSDLPGSALDEEEWVSSGNTQRTCRDGHTLRLEVDNSNLEPHRGTRERRQFDPNQIPSGTLEMGKLTMHIEADSATSNDDGCDASDRESKQLSNSALCMAL